MRSGSISPAVRWSLGAFFAVALLCVWNRQIADTPIIKDAAQIVHMAINLEHHGVISMDEKAPYKPSDYREPLPVMTTAVAATVVDLLEGPAAPDAYLSGVRVRMLKYQNLVWLALLSGGAFWAVRVLGGPFLLGLVGIVVVNLRFLSWHGGGEIDDLLTEIPAAAVLMWASVALSKAFTTRRLTWFVAAGLLLGVLALIKAAILYVFVGLLGVWLLVNLWQRSVGWVGRLLRETLLLTLAFGCVVGPWMARNWVDIGSFEISQRAGVVLMYRALHDLMTPTEYRGAFYIWAPASVKAPMGRILGFSFADTQRTGRLHRLNDELRSDFAADDLDAELTGRPERAISFYREARARREQAVNVLSAAGRSDADAETEADKILKRQALTVFREHPWRHLAATVPFMWRGAIQTFPILVAVISLALWFGRYDLAAFALPALGIVVEYALFTHFIARYDEPANAIGNVALLMVLSMLWMAFRGRRSMVGGRSAPV